MSRVAQWYTNFRKDFPPGQPADPFTPKSDPSKYPKTTAHKRKLAREIRRIEREIGQIEGGNRGVRQDALRETDKEVNRLRRAGNRINAKDRKEIFERILKQLIEERTRPLREELDRLRQQLADARERDRIDREEKTKRRRERRERRKRPITSPGVRDWDTEDDSLNRRAAMVRERDRLGREATGGGGSDANRADGAQRESARALIQAAKDISESSRRSGEAVEHLERVASQLGGIFAEVAAELGGAERRLARAGG